ncbi:hypothetical protein C1645_834294, partial [Glomus cerebriforme]
MTIQLIGFAGSTYTMVVLGVLEELGLPTDISPPANFSDIKTPEYLAEKHP